MPGRSGSEFDCDHTAVFEHDTFGLRKAVGVCRRIEEEEGKHWIGWTEGMDWGKNASVADVTGGNEMHYWHYWSGRRMWNVAHSCFLGMPWHG